MDRYMEERDLTDEERVEKANILKEIANANRQYNQIDK